VARRVMRAHFSKVPIVDPMLPPFFNEWIDQDRKV
jgi:hypothetical protein